MAGSQRSQQPSTGGLGKVFTSPTKRRAKKKTTVIAKHLGQDKKINDLRRKLEMLQNSRFDTTEQTPQKAESITEMEQIPPPVQGDVPLETCGDVLMDTDAPMDTNLPMGLPRKARGVLPNNDSHKLFDRWKNALPSLVNPLLSHISSTMGKKWEMPKERSRRIWMLDRQLISIGAEMRDDLGNWLTKRRRNIDKQEHQAQKILHDCGIPEVELRKQWKDQRAAQLSLQAHAPARLKRELDTVLILQGDLDTVDNAIDALATTSDNVLSKISLSSLRETQEKLKEQVEELYASLNVHDSFPELANVDLDFFEWDKLDRATKGRQQPLGTKLHQYTMKAIKKRTPALLTAIRKFNSYCSRLAELHNPDWGIPLPTALPTKLDELRGNGSTILMEDVWISQAPGEVPRWLEDVDVWEGIRAMLKIERCHEERVRIGAEADNLCRWFGREMSAVEVALELPSNDSIKILLLQHRTRIRSLKAQWTNPMASSIHFDTHLKTAVDVASMVARSAGIDVLKPAPTTVTWLQPLIDDQINANGQNDLDEDPDDGSAPVELKHFDGDDVVDSLGTLLDDFIEDEVWQHFFNVFGHGLAMSVKITVVVPPRDMYRRTAKLDYWKKDIWILPIHRATPEKHWVILADSSPWKREMNEIMLLVRGLVLGANLNGHSLHVITEEGWIARPLVTMAVQSGPQHSRIYYVWYMNLLAKPTIAWQSNSSNQTITCVVSRDIPSAFSSAVPTPSTCKISAS
ncbi:hypothetical protein K443DRAFT_122207 [Laccaria amethystina LaAM-08-1]|uniref:Ubiquitin-like protease family profile domain-containing protein n=1 Tax=Laccaria amethystina LaAM-08-1 TaxID=1095629 RepID=A0A0C9XJZ2_9AGAR|nr:hypothetical protein K443DRAFT_122207 [Laccaria amethystina LaAM-08-1]